MARLTTKEDTRNPGYPLPVVPITKELNRMELIK